MKRLLSVMSIVAVVNMIALAGLGMYGWKMGWLEKERVRAAALLLFDGIAEEAPAGDEPSEPGAATAVQRIAHSNEASQIRHAELDRREREIEHAWQQLETQQLAFLKEKEALDSLRKRFAEEATARVQKAGDGGWQRELELMGSIKPKLAKELFREKPDAEVVKLMSELDVRKAKKIIEQCKTSEERLWIGRILEQLQQRDASQAEALVAGKVSNQGA